MSRKHLFPLVVLLAAAVVAGLLALTRTAGLGEPASASTGSDAAIAFRLKELDGFEAALRKQLAEARTAPAGSSQTVYQRAAAAPSSQDEHDENEHGDDEDDLYETDDRDD